MKKATTSPPLIRVNTPSVVVARQRIRAKRDRGGGVGFVVDSDRIMCDWCCFDCHVGCIADAVGLGRRRLAGPRLLNGARICELKARGSLWCCRHVLGVRGVVRDTDPAWRRIIMELGGVGIERADNKQERPIDGKGINLGSKYHIGS
jgi:hypothetical protein